MSKPNVGDRFEVTNAFPFSVGSVIEYTGEEKVGQSPLFKLISGSCHYNNYKGKPGAFFEGWEKHTVKVEEKEMSKFKVGDKVRVIAESNGWGAVSKGDVGVIAHVSDTHLQVNFPAQSDWRGTHNCFELAEEGHINTKDMYSNIMGQGIVCGDTEIRAAKRRRKGEQQYVISYTNSKVQNGVVKHSDIPALVAALLDIYDGDVKEEEVPF